MNQILITMKSFVGTMFGPKSADVLQHLTNQVGADGVEFFPVKCGATTQVIKGGIDPNHHPFKAGYQSWRSEQNIKMLLAFYLHHRKNPKLCYVATVAHLQVIERRKSMDYLLKLQELAREIPITIYPHHTGTIGGQSWNESEYPEFGYIIHNSLIQPEPSLLQKDRWNTSTPEKFGSHALTEGFTGFCLSVHIMEAWPEAWQEATTLFFPSTRLMRVNPDDPKSQLLLKHLVKTLGYKGPIVVRIKGSPFMSQAAFIAKYTEAVTAIQQILRD